MEVQSRIVNVEHVTYVSDVEGHWEYFCNFVRLSAGLKFHLKHDGRLARTAEDLELDLTDGWHFVFGGDASDKGPGTLRFQEALVRLKRKYPDRVHLLMGNRDINKMALTSELTDEEIADFRHVPGERRSNGTWRVGGLDYLKEVASVAEKIGVEDVTEDMLDRYCTGATKLKYFFKYKMNSDDEFEFRRQELAFLRNISLAQVSDKDVFKSYQISLSEGGWTREYMRLAQLGIWIDSALFVHGQIIGNEFDPKKTRGVDEHGVARCIGVVPNLEESVENIGEWLTVLNAWGQDEVRDWERRPTWDSPRCANGNRSRGGAGLLNYGCATSVVPTIVYCRWLTKASMPLQYPPDLSAYLLSQGVRYVVVGHTPHGNAPTVIQSDGVCIIMADTSFSEMKANRAFEGDNRGAAVSDIAFDRASCIVKGLTESGEIIDYSIAAGVGDKFVGHIQDGDPPEERFFVKARLPRAPGRTEDSYIMCNIQGFKYKYAVIRAADLPANLNRLGVDAVVSAHLSGCGRLGGLDECHFLEHLFATLDEDADGNVRKMDLAAACTDCVVRAALMMNFPRMSMAEIFKAFHADMDGRISKKEFRKALSAKRVVSRHLEQSGIYFEVLVEGEDPVGRSFSTDSSSDEFPRSLPPLMVIPTVCIRPSDLHVRWDATSRLKSDGCECALSPEVFRTDALRRLCRHSTTASLQGQLSPVSPVNLPDEARRRANIFASAANFAWSYPMISDWSLTSDMEDISDDPDVLFLTIGGFVYFDSDFQIVQINAVMSHPMGGLRFGPPRQWRTEWTDRLRQQRGRWRPVTLRSFNLAGAMEFCWLRPNEFVEHSSDGCKFSSGDYGAFAYIGKMSEPAY